MDIFNTGLAPQRGGVPLLGHEILDFGENMLRTILGNDGVSPPGSGS